MYPYLETYQAAAALFSQRGFETTPPRGASVWSKHMVCLEHDGVPYCLNNNDCYGKLDASKIDRGLQRRQLIIQRYHAKVKAVYDYVAAQGLGDIWAMCGGGAQLQVFFGNRKGYVAILYLDLEDLGEQERLSDYLTAVGNQSHTLVVNGLANDPYFESMSIAGVQLRTHKATYGE